MILKPFMLRRIKKDVENELSDKIEVMVYCPLTTRQKLLYSGKYWFLFMYPPRLTIINYSIEEKNPNRRFTSLHRWRRHVFER